MTSDLIEITHLMIRVVKMGLKTMEVTAIDTASSTLVLLVVLQPTIRRTTVITPTIPTTRFSRTLFRELLLILELAHLSW